MGNMGMNFYGKYTRKITDKLFLNDSIEQTGSPNTENLPQKSIFIGSLIVFQSFQKYWNI